VRPEIRCNGNAVAALYPSQAGDNDIEADIPVEVVIDRTGRIVRARARSNPGFGLAAAAERAVLTACRTTVIPRDAQGREVGTRVVHTIGFHLD
jgi:outer membrane biosynthesis protein TonB